MKLSTLARHVLGSVGFFVSGVWGQTWSVDLTHNGESYLNARAHHGSQRDSHDVFFEKFGDYTVAADNGVGRFAMTLRWGDHSAHNTSSVLVTESTPKTNQYVGYTSLNFISDSDAILRGTLDFDWQGSGQWESGVLLHLFDITDEVVYEVSHEAPAGPVFTNVDAPIHQGHQYWLFYYSYVWGFNRMAGVGAGTTSLELVVPSPAAASMLVPAAVFFVIRPRHRSH